MQRCPSSLFEGTPQSVAQRLIGHTLVRRLNGGRLSGIIVEVEAYLSSQDSASHSANGPKKRNASMFRNAGHLYVYTIHTRHCLNIVTESSGTGSAILVRAVEPLEGLAIMSELRRQDRPQASSSMLPWLKGLTSGPGRLCQALDVDLSLDGSNLVESDQIWIEPPVAAVQSRRWSLGNSPRIGITKAAELPLRWFMDGHQLVSGCARDHSQGRWWRFLQDLTTKSGVVDPNNAEEPIRSPVP